MSISQYQRQLIINSSPGELIIMFYNRVEFYLNIALKDINNIKTRVESISKAIELIEALSNSIDGSIGDDLLDPLRELYLFFITELTLANKAATPDKIEYVLTQMRDLKKTWEHAIELEKQNTSAKV